MSEHPIPNAALSAHLAVLDTTGDGKSITARGMVELHLERQHLACIRATVRLEYAASEAAKGDPKA